VAGDSTDAFRGWLEDRLAACGKPHWARLLTAVIALEPVALTWNLADGAEMVSAYALYECRFIAPALEEADGALREAQITTLLQQILERGEILDGDYDSGAVVKSTIDLEGHRASLRVMIELDPGQ
jgi:hypothetical protein